jgi:glycerol-3-phosphate dehydrogenase
MKLDELPADWDLIVIGGGINGAGVLREASRMGLGTLLLEQNDFGWGTSSRSSKLVHGGLRYLKQGRIRLTKMAVEEREYLLKNAPGLVEPLGFFFPVYADQHPGRRTMRIGLSLYDILAHDQKHIYYDATEFKKYVPYINPEGLIGGFFFFDAQTDDSRLVLRLIMASMASGATALNYTAVKKVLRNENGAVCGVEVTDVETRESRTLSTRCVINATGCWAEVFHPSPDARRHLRPLRGSHLVFPKTVLPVSQGIGFVHPVDNRSVFVVPWEGATLVGTTDLDHHEDLSKVPTITQVEVDYLVEGVRRLFPSFDLSADHCIAAFAGVRPVLSEDDRPPSDESREHAVWVDRGLVTAVGGKLTTFRRLARGALKAAAPFLPHGELPDKGKSIFADAPDMPANWFGLAERACRRLRGRYGNAAGTLVQMARPKDLTPVPGTDTLWAELPFVAKNEQVRHLNDLLLRRVRIGILTPFGGKAHLKRIRRLCRNALPWDRRRWKEEEKNYLDLWLQIHALPSQRAQLRAKAKKMSFGSMRAILPFTRAGDSIRPRGGKAGR